MIKIERKFKCFRRKLGKKIDIYVAGIRESISTDSKDEYIIHLLPALSIHRVTPKTVFIDINFLIWCLLIEFHRK